MIENRVQWAWVMPLDTSKSVLQSIGTYDLLDKVAEGGMGSVYKARDQQTGQIVAIKIMPPHTASNGVLLKRFEQEFRAASRLDHPNIVRALDYGDSGSTPYLVMEFVEGESLGQKIQRDGRLPEAEAIRIIAQIAQGLYRAHKLGLVHRDVKPDNILVMPDGTAKLADLGLVKEVDADLNLTRTGRGLGTPHFMAPEQFRNAKNADSRCDVYSLGATLYMTATGELPFRSSGPLDAWMKKMHNELVPPRQIVPGLSERIDWAIRRAMSADPDQRPASCREFVEDLTGRSTRRLNIVENGNTTQELWYLVYKDEDGVAHTVKGSVSAIRRSLKEGLLGDAGNIRASHSKTGPFELLRSYAEFRDMVVAPAPLTIPRTDSGTKIPSKTNSDPGSALAGTVPMPARHTPTPINRDTDEQPIMPHIDLVSHTSTSPQSLEWLKWILLLFIAAAAAIVGFFFLPV